MSPAQTPTKLAAIDIGSNSIHLVVAQAAPNRTLEVLEREKEMVRLGAGSLRVHKLSKQQIDVAMEVLRRYKKMCEALKVETIIATATAAVRESNNADEFVERARREAGLDVRVLPGVEEARLIGLAVSEVTDFNGRRGLIIDIGGGSTELIVTSGAEAELLLSLRLGAVRLSEKYITGDPVSEDEAADLIAVLRADLTRPVREVSTLGFDFAVGSSGTVINLVAAIVQEEREAHGESNERPISAGETVSLAELHDLNRRLAVMPSRDRARVPGIEPRRADIIVAGGLLLETLMSELGAKKITSCDWSLREGVILDYLRNHQADYTESQARARDRRAAVAWTPVAGREPGALGAGGETDLKTRSVLSVAERYEYDPNHAGHISRLAASIFDDTRLVHRLGNQERRLLQYSALLHDIGYHIAHNNHHRHSLYLIKNSEMPGFNSAELAIIGNVARYHRGPMPAAVKDAKSRREHDDFYALDRAARHTVIKLASMLRIADGLDRSYQQRVTSVHCSITGRDAIFALSASGDCDLEIWSAGRKADWFRQVFRMATQFVLIPGAGPDKPEDRPEDKP